MINITHYSALDFFIMESDERRQNVMGAFDIGVPNHNLQQILDYYNYKPTDFTDVDWQEILEYCK